MLDEYSLAKEIIRTFKENLTIFSIFSAILGGVLVIFYCSTIKYYPSGLTISDTIFFLWVISIFGLIYSIVVFIFLMASIFWVLTFSKPINYFFNKFLPQHNLHISMPPKNDNLMILSVGAFINIFLIVFTYIKGYLFYVSCSILMNGFIYILIINLVKNHDLTSDKSILYNKNENFAHKNLLNEKAAKLFLCIMIYFVPLLFAQIGGNITRITFETMGVRQNSVDVLIKPDYKSTFEAYRIQDFLSDLSGKDECLLKNVNILFTGIGTTTKLQVTGTKGQIEIVIPTESIYLIAKTTKYFIQ